MSKTLITIFILFLPLLHCKKKEILNASNLIELLKLLKQKSRSCFNFSLDSLKRELSLQTQNQLNDTINLGYTSVLYLSFTFNFHNFHNPQ